MSESNLNLVSVLKDIFVKWLEKQTKPPRPKGRLTGAPLQSKKKSQIEGDDVFFKNLPIDFGIPQDKIEKLPFHIAQELIPLGIDADIDELTRLVCPHNEPPAETGGSIIRRAVFALETPGRRIVPRSAFAPQLG